MGNTGQCWSDEAYGSWDSDEMTHATSLHTVLCLPSTPLEGVTYTQDSGFHVSLVL